VASGAALDGPASSMTCSSCLRADRPEPLRAQFRGLATAAQISHATELAPTDQTADEVLTTSLAQLAGVVRLLDGHLAADKAQLAALVGSWMPELLAEFGVGPVAAAQLLVSWSHPGRCRSAAAFAMLASTAPLQASSGRGHPLPPQPRRGPAAQPGPAGRRAPPTPPRPPHPRLRRPPTSRRKHRPRDPPLPHWMSSLARHLWRVMEHHHPAAPPAPTTQPSIAA